LKSHNTSTSNPRRSVALPPPCKSDDPPQLSPFDIKRATEKVLNEREHASERRRLWRVGGPPTQHPIRPPPVDPNQVVEETYRLAAQLGISTRAVESVVKRRSAQAKERQRVEKLASIRECGFVL
jgi:hypothetical protein